MWEMTTTYEPKVLSQYEKGQEYGWSEARKFYKEHILREGKDSIRPSTEQIAILIVENDIKSFDIEIPKGSSEEFERGVESYIEFLKLRVQKARIDAQTEPKIIKVEF